MAHFAELDENNIVIRVLVIGDGCCLDENGQESESVGKAYCKNLLGGRWIQTSYNGRIRGRYAGIGYSYNDYIDEFIPPKPNSEQDWTWNRANTAWEITQTY
jgi:hypothetical protein